MRVHGATSELYIKNSLIRKVRIIFFQYFIITHRADVVNLIIIIFKGLCDLDIIAIFFISIKNGDDALTTVQSGNFKI